MSIVDLPPRHAIVDGVRREYVVAAERVYGRDPTTGARVLLYPVGAPVPVEEAVALGLIETGKAVEKLEAEDKALEQGETEDKAVGAAQAAKRRARRKSE